MSYTTKGKIISISEVKDFENGAKSLDYQVETSEQYNNLYSFEMYKGADHVEHIDNFVKYNKVGDKVEVEFNVRTNNYQGKFYTSLSSWKCSKVDTNQDGNYTPIDNEDADDMGGSLPF